MNVLENLLDALFPPACAVCGRPRSFVDGKRRWLHRKCAEKLVYISEPRCQKCGKGISDDEAQLCFDCRKSKHIFNQSIAVYEYGQGIKQSIYNFKYKNKREYATFYANEMYKYCRDLINVWEPEVIIPVPLHYSKYKKRGYNQAELIASELGRIADIPVDSDSLIRVKKTIPMKELDDEKRVENLKNAFQFGENSVKYRKILIVDDIYTTGATLDACALILRNAGAEEVYGICLCVGKGF